MARITVEDCLRRENNRFALVLLAAKRTKQLLKGAKYLLPEMKNKPVVSALREIASGGVRFMTEEEREAYLERERLRAKEAPVLQPEVRTPVAVNIEFRSIDDEFDGAGAKGGDDE